MSPSTPTTASGKPKVSSYARQKHDAARAAYGDGRDRSKHKTWCATYRYSLGLECNCRSILTPEADKEGSGE